MYFYLTGGFFGQLVGIPDVDRAHPLAAGINRYRLDFWYLDSTWIFAAGQQQTLAEN